MPTLHTLLALVPLRNTQRRFLSILLVVWLAVPGRLNAAQFARYSGMNEKTLRNWFCTELPWMTLHTTLVEQLMESGHVSQTLILGIDASFVPKSGTATAGVGNFWNGCHSRVEQGLELSCCTLISVHDRQAFPVHVQQTQPTTATTDNRTEQYNAQLSSVLTDLPTKLKAALRAVVGDGQYAKKCFMDTVTQHGLALVSKLQRNADLLYRAVSVPNGKRGRPRKYQGKVDLHDLERWDLEHEDSRERSFTLVVYAPRFGRDLRVVVVQRLDRMGRVQSQAVLSSTDVSMTAEEVQRLYAARFEADRPGRRAGPVGAVLLKTCRFVQDMEFVFRDAKQYAGLTTCQMRSSLALHTHWNVALLTVSLVRAHALQGLEQGQDLVFGMEDAKRRAYNALYTRHLLSHLGQEARFDEIASIPSGPLDFGLKAA